MSSPITSMSVSAKVEGYETGGFAGSYRCEFQAIPAVQQYRPPRRTPKPFVQGPQTAVVVGPGGDEIFTDKYGRVKVQWCCDKKQYQLKKRGRAASLNCQRLGSKKHSCVTHAA